MEFDLKRILKALLFSNSEPLAIKEIQGVITRFHHERETSQNPTQTETVEIDHEANEAPLDSTTVPTLLTASQIRDAMNTISRELEERGEVFRLIENSQGYRLATAPEFAPWVRLLHKGPRPLRLSQAALETLAIIAYRQPTTRAEIEAIRGVAADSPLTKLLEYELIHIAGRAEVPGRPLQYGTTEKFLTFAGIQHIGELPASDVLSPNQINEWIQKVTTEDEQTLSDKDVGLPEDPKPQPEVTAH